MTIVQDKPLTQKRENFCQCIFKGMNQTEAYKASFDCENESIESIYVNASRLMTDAKVQLRIKELRDSVAEKTILSIHKKREILFNLATDSEIRPRDRINSIDIDNKMIRLYADQQVQPGQQIINVIAYSPETKHLVDAFLSKEEPKQIAEPIDITTNNEAE